MPTWLCPWKHQCSSAKGLASIVSVLGRPRHTEPSNSGARQVVACLGLLQVEGKLQDGEVVGSLPPEVVGPC